MSYLSKMRYADSGNLDAFDRLRTSTPVTLFDSSQYYGDNALVWENQFVGTGAVSNSLNQSSVIMTTGGTGSTASAIRQTKKTFHYFPGKSQSVSLTFCFTGGGVTNNTRRAGLFDAQNGVYFELAGTTVNMVLRTYTSGSVVESRIPQASWNLDVMNGTGPSGLTLDVTKAQIFTADLQWLGAGRVRVGFNINGAVYYVHQFLCANVLTIPYMGTANLPVRFENFNSVGTAGGTATLQQICATVVTEGVTEPLRGFQFSASNGQTAVTIPSSSTTTFTPVLSIRASTTGPNSQPNKGQIVFQTISQLVVSLTCQWALFLNGTLTGASFAKVNSTYSLAEVDVASSAISGGIIIDSGYNAGGSTTSASELNGLSLASELSLGYSGLLNTQDTLTIAARAVGTAGTMFAEFSWLELQ